MILRHRIQLSVNQSLNSLIQQFGTHYSQPVKKFSRRLVFAYFGFPHKQYIAGIQPYVRKHCCNAGDLIAVDNAPLDRSCTSQLWQKAAVNIYAAILGDCQILCGKYLAECRCDHKLGGKFPQRRNALFAAYLFKLVYGYIVFLCKYLCRGRGQLALASLGPVKVGKQRQLMPLVDEHLKGGHSKIRGAKESYAHYSSSSSYSISSVYPSGGSVTKRP